MSESEETLDRLATDTRIISEKGGYSPLTSGPLSPPVSARHYTKDGYRPTTAGPTSPPVKPPTAPPTEKK